MVDAHQVLLDDYASHSLWPLERVPVTLLESPILAPRSLALHPCAASVPKALIGNLNTSRKFQSRATSHNCRKDVLRGRSKVRRYGPCLTVLRLVSHLNMLHSRHSGEAYAKGRARSTTSQHTGVSF